jgi:hypothetical protein
MATLVEADNVRILIDPGAALAPSRFGLPPSPEERHAYEEATSRIIGTLCQVDAVVVTRYHEEHINLLPYVLSTTAVYLKAPTEGGERRAAREMLQRLERTGRSFELVGDSSVRWRDVALSFSPPLPEGKSGPGLAMAVSVRSGDSCFVHGSDAHGPLAAAAFDWLLQQRADLVYLSGPPTYRIGFDDAPIAAADLRTCRTHLAGLLRYSGCRVILDHALFRDPSPRRWYADLFAAGRVQSAAGFLGLPERPLEARRREASPLGLALLPPVSPACQEDRETALAAAG